MIIRGESGSILNKTLVAGIHETRGYLPVESFSVEGSRMFFSRRIKASVMTTCVASITTRDGRTIYASDYGFKCFPIGGHKKQKPRQKMTRPVRKVG